jgi:hypothetical protein
VESDEVCEPPAACFIKEAEPKVSSILRWCLFLFQYLKFLHF